MRLLLIAAVLTAAVSGPVHAVLPNCAATIGAPTVLTVNPGQSIQSAINKAKPGTVIRVKAGQYNGSLDISRMQGTAGKPILLVSADGPGAAVIVGAPGTVTVKGAPFKQGTEGMRYFGMYGFKVVSNGGAGAFKLWGPWENPAHDLVFAGNTIVGNGTADAFKLFNGAYNVIFAGNVIDGQWKQEAIDNVSVEDVIYAYNTVVGSAKRTGITIKAGSRNIEITRNYLNPVGGWGISIGGFGNSRLDRTFPAYWWGFEAEDVTVSGNVVGPNLSGRSAIFVGARYSTLVGNRLPKTVGSAANSEPGYFNYHSHHNTIRDNSVTRSDFFDPSAGEAVGYVLERNAIGKSSPVAGASAFTDNLLGICPGRYVDGVP